MNGVSDNLTETEQGLLDNYFIKHNIINIDEAEFFSALGNIVPTWRCDQLAGNKIYTNERSMVYNNYIKKLYFDK